jgi:hypothetical protein
MQFVTVLDSNISLYERDDAECAWQSFRLFVLPSIMSSEVETSLNISWSRRFLDSLGMTDHALDSFVFEVAFAF